MPKLWAKGTNLKATRAHDALVAAVAHVAQLMAEGGDADPRWSLSLSLQAMRPSKLTSTVARMAIFTVGISYSLITFSPGPENLGYWH